MAENDNVAVTPESEELTPEKVQHTFDQLGLNDPRTRDRLLKLAAVSEEQQAVGSWTNADSGTGCIQ